MQKMVFIITALLIGACGSKTELVEILKGDAGPSGISGVDGVNGANGTSCSVEQLENGAKITCTDGSFATVQNGSQGELGREGERGPDGSSCSTTPTEAGALITCSNGTSAELLNGSTGQAGTGCSVAEIVNGAAITCGSSSVSVYNGEAGTPGSNAPSSTITTYSNNVCTLIAGTNKYVKNSNNNTSLYSSSSCNNNTKFAQVSQGESYWVGPRDLAIYNSSNSIRVIHFN